MKVRDYKISYIRAISTVMVVALHTANHLAKTAPCIVADWLNLGLVMFFVMSAFLYSKRTIRNKDYKAWLLHRYSEIVIPSFFAALLAIAYFYALVYAGNGTVSKQNILSSIICGLGFEAFAPAPWKFVEYWFLTYILICYVFLPLIQKIDFKKPKNFQFWIGILLMSVIMQGILSVSGIPISWGVMLRFYLAYAVFRRYDVQDIECRKTIIALSICVIPFIAAVCYIRYFLVLDGTLAMLAELFFIYIQSFAGLALFYWLYILFGHMKNLPKLIKITDKYSYPVYLTHSFFIGYDTSLIDKFDNRVLGIAVALLLTALASTVVLDVTKPINRKINSCINKTHIKKSA